MPVLRDDRVHGCVNRIKEHRDGAGFVYEYGKISAS
jgi:hypothetical protein